LNEFRYLLAKFNLLVEGADKLALAAAKQCRRLTPRQQFVQCAYVMIRDRIETLSSDAAAQFLAVCELDGLRLPHRDSVCSAAAKP
jgi:hypothetical protein